MIMAVETSSRISSLRTNCRHCIIQPKMRSTTQRRGNGAEPCRLARRRTTSTTKSRKAALSSSWRRSYAPSANKCLTQGQRRLSASSTGSALVELAM